MSPKPAADVSQNVVSSADFDGVILQNLKQLDFMHSEVIEDIKKVSIDKHSEEVQCGKRMESAKGLKNRQDSDSQASYSSEILDHCGLDTDDSPRKTHSPALADNTNKEQSLSQASLKIQANQSCTRSYTSFASFDGDSDEDEVDLHHNNASGTQAIHNNFQVEVRRVKSCEPESHQNNYSNRLIYDDPSFNSHETSTNKRTFSSFGVRHSQPSTGMAWAPIQINPLESDRMRRSTPTFPRQKTPNNKSFVAGSHFRSWSRGKRIRSSKANSQERFRSQSAASAHAVTPPYRDGVYYVPITIKTIDAADVFGPPKTATHPRIQRELKIAENMAGSYRPELRNRSVTPARNGRHSQRRSSFDILHRVESEDKPDICVEVASTETTIEDIEKETEELENDPYERKLQTSYLLPNRRLYNVLTQSLPMVIVTDESEDEKVLISGEAETEEQGGYLEDQVEVESVEDDLDNDYGSIVPKTKERNSPQKGWRPRSAPAPTLRRRTSYPGTFRSPAVKVIGIKGQKTVTKSNKGLKSTASKIEPQKKQVPKQPPKSIQRPPSAEKKKITKGGKQDSVDSLLSTCTEDEVDDSGDQGHSKKPGRGLRPRSANIYRRRFSRPTLLKQDSWDQQDFSDSSPGTPTIVVSDLEPRQASVEQDDLDYEEGDTTPVMNHIRLLKVPEWKNPKSDTEDEGESDEEEHIDKIRQF